jgi:hypothetical protein
MEWWVDVRLATEVALDPQNQLGVPSVSGCSARAIQFASLADSASSVHIDLRMSILDSGLPALFHHRKSSAGNRL